MLKRAILGTILMFWALSSSTVSAACGDLNGDNQTNSSDLIFASNYLFADGPAPTDFDQADADDYHLFTVRDFQVLLDFVFSAGPAPVCPPANPPLTPPITVNNYVTVTESVMPANETDIVLHFNFDNDIPLKAVILPIRIEIGGQPIVSGGIVSTSASPRFNIFSGLSEPRIDDANSVVGFLFSGGTLTVGSGEMAQVSVSIASEPSDRDITISWATFGPNQGGQDAHYPLLLEAFTKIGPTAWTPALGPPPVCGDLNGNGNFDVSDFTYSVSFLLLGGPAPVNDVSGDADDYELYTIRDQGVILDRLFGGGPAPVCPPSNPPLIPTPDPSNHIDLVEQILPAGLSQITLNFNFTNSIPLEGFVLPVELRVDGEIPTFGNIVIDPSYPVNVTALTDAANGVVGFISLKESPTGFLSANSSHLATVEISVAQAEAFNRPITISLTSMPPQQLGQNVHYAMILEHGPKIGPVAWEPVIQYATDPVINLVPGQIVYPAHTSPGIQLDSFLTVTNSGGATLNYTVSVEENNGPPGWLSISGFSGSIAAGNSEIGTIHLNDGGIVDAQMVADSGGALNLLGRLIFSSNATRSVDSFPISFYVIDESLEPEQDTLTGGGQTSITVDHNGNFGNQGQGGANMDFSDAGDCDAMATVYLFDGSPVLGYLDGNDTVVNFSMYGSGFRTDVGFRPGVGELHYDGYMYDAYSTGVFTSSDGQVSLEQTWYAPRNFSTNDHNFYILSLKLWSSDGSILNGLTAGTAIDWNIPSDNGNDNSSDVDISRNLIFQIGGETDMSGCQPNDNRTGGIAFLEATINGESIAEEPHGAYTADNATYVDPTGSFVPVDLYASMANPGFSLYTSGKIDSPLVDLHMVVTAVSDLTLTGGDTLELFYVLASGKDGTLDFKSSIDNGKLFYRNRIQKRPNYVQGLYNIHVVDAAIGGQASAINIIVQGDITGATVTHFEVTDSTGNGDYKPIGSWGTSSIVLDGNGNTRISISSVSPLNTGDAVFIGLSAADDSSEIILLDQYWADGSDNRLRDIELEQASFKNSTGVGFRILSDTLVFYRVVCPWTAESFFRFFHSSVNIPPDSIMGNLGRFAGVEEFTPDDTLLAFYFNTIENKLCAYYQTLMPLDLVKDKIVYVQTTLKAYGIIFMQKYDKFIVRPVCCFGFRGNANYDFLDGVDILDVLFLVEYLFQGGATPPCIEEADVNGSGGQVPIDVIDVIFLAAYLFQGGDIPPFCPTIQ